MEVKALLLGGTLYLWQMPQFFAHSYMHQVDSQDGEKMAGLVVLYTCYLSAMLLVAGASQVTSSVFAFKGIALNAYTFSVAYQFQQKWTISNDHKN
jgi:hypothetical protein